MKKHFSVLMSVYYKETPSFLNNALKSIFNQSVIPNEVVLVEDGKLTSELDKVISSYKNKYPKIMNIIKFKENRGLGQALHDGLIECHNDIVFRMDSDDECMPNRFEDTLKIFDKMNIDVVGSNIVEYDNDMINITGYRKVPQSHEEIIKMMKKRNPMNHVTIAYKKDKVIESGNYVDMPFFEDYYLWARMYKYNCKFYNIQECLVKVRGGDDMIQRRGGVKYIKLIMKFQKELLKLKVTNIMNYLFNISVRSLVSLMPNSLRSAFYKKNLRK